MAKTFVCVSARNYHGTSNYIDAFVCFVLTIALVSPPSLPLLFPSLYSPRVVHRCCCLLPTSLPPLLRYLYYRRTTHPRGYHPSSPAFSHEPTNEQTAKRCQCFPQAVRAAKAVPTAMPMAVAVTAIVVVVVVVCLASGPAVCGLSSHLPLRRPPTAATRVAMAAAAAVWAVWVVRVAGAEGGAGGGPPSLRSTNCTDRSMAWMPPPLPSRPPLRVPAPLQLNCLAFPQRR